MVSFREQAKRREEISPARDNRNTVSQLQSLYRHYAAPVHTLCLRLLADRRSAVTATVDTFVWFGRIPSRQWNGSRALSCLRELAIEVSLARLKEGNGDTQEAAATLISKGNGSLDPAKLDGLIAELPDGLRVVYVLREGEGLSDADIAIRLRFDRAEVRRRVHDARLELHRLWLRK